ncbi:MAG: TetR/AcrR family transcriptional regulator [Planctomycetota bacterium]
MHEAQPNARFSGLVHRADAEPAPHRHTQADPPPADPASANAAPASPAPAPAPPRKPLDRRLILDRTLDSLSEVGYDKTTIRAIAKRIGCAVGSIYRHFEDKRQLLSAVAESRFEAVAEFAQIGRDPAAVGRLYVAAAHDHPELYRLLFWLAGVGKPAGPEAMPPVIARIVQGWAKSLDSEAAAKRFWAGLHGAVMLGQSADQAVALARAAAQAAVEAAPAKPEPAEAPPAEPATYRHAPQALAAS